MAVGISRDTLANIRDTLREQDRYGSTMRDLCIASGRTRQTVYVALRYLKAEQDTEFYPPIWRLPAA